VVAVNWLGLSLLLLGMETRGVVFWTGVVLSIGTSLAMFLYALRARP
jgi:hypothetical protein